MNSRRFFLRSTAVLAGSMVAGQRNSLRAATNAYDETLAAHVIEHVEWISAKYQWPRFVGRNSQKDFHGQAHTVSVCRLFTNQGASGWGSGAEIARPRAEEIKGRRVSELISIESGIKEGIPESYDFALHDLAGVILDKPVYELLGGKGPKASPVYSGMIYIDELNEGNPNKKIDIILKNCQWDYDYGYRQLKVKIGRSSKWYPHDEGLAKDIEVVNEIHKAFHEKGVRLLVDANNGYSLEDTIAFLKGISGVPLFWFEEPFHENQQDGRKLKRWMLDNGFENTLYADGEAKPDHEVLKELGRSGDLDVYLTDIVGLGFTPWRTLMPEIAAMGVQASPHAWGNALKTNYVSHLAAGFGNTVTVEGVTCESDDIDFGNYPIQDGMLKVSDAPGFGMKLRV